MTQILNEIKRVLKNNGKIVLDFATDIERFNQKGERVVFEGEGNYQKEEAISFFQEQLKEFNLCMNLSIFKEENLEVDAGYQSIIGNFLVIYGIKK